MSWYPMGKEKLTLGIWGSEMKTPQPFRVCVTSKIMLLCTPVRFLHVRAGTPVREWRMVRRLSHSNHLRLTQDRGTHRSTLQTHISHRSVWLSTWLQRLGPTSGRSGEKDSQFNGDQWTLLKHPFFLKGTPAGPHTCLQGGIWRWSPS